MTVRELLENFPLAVIGVDRNRLVGLWNGAAERLLGWPAAEVLGHPDPSIPAEVAAEHKTLWKAAWSREYAAQRESERMTRDGRVLDVTVTTAAAEGLALMFVTDVTMRYAEEERRLAAAMIRRQEEQRRAIARELHDELGQLLIALRLGVPASMFDLVDQTIATVRRVATELRPRVLDDFGLRAALENETSTFAARTGIDVRLTIRGDETIDRDCATALYRIVQEGLTNVARHSGATRADIRIEAGAARIEAELRDNGRGITDAQLNDTTALGLLGVRERACALGGEAIIEAIPGEGTRVYVSLPR